MVVIVKTRLICNVHHLINPADALCVLMNKEIHSLFRTQWQSLLAAVKYRIFANIYFYIHN